MRKLDHLLLHLGAAIAAVCVGAIEAVAELLSPRVLLAMLCVYSTVAQSQVVVSGGVITGGVVNQGSQGTPNPVIITTLSIPGGTQSVFYSKTIATTGGTIPFTWSCLDSTGAATSCSAVLPAGVSLDGTGKISGTPSVSGNFTFGAEVCDSSSPVTCDQRQYVLQVAPSQSSSCGPPYLPCSTSSQALFPQGPPPFTGSTGKGAMAFDTTGLNVPGLNPIWRLTDSTTCPAGAGGSGAVVSKGGNDGEGDWNLDSTAIVVTCENTGSVVVVGWDPVNHVSTGVTPAYVPNINSPEWSRTNKFILYSSNGTKIWKTTFTSFNPPVYTQTTLVDLAAAGTCPALTGQTTLGSGTIHIDKNDTVLFGDFRVTQEQPGYWVAYNLGTAKCSVVNSSTGQITHYDGSVTTASGSNLCWPIGVHGASLFKNGLYASLQPATNTTCTFNPVDMFWQIDTSSVVACNPSISGHEAKGYNLTTIFGNPQMHYGDVTHGGAVCSELQSQIYLTAMQNGQTTGCNGTFGCDNENHFATNYIDNADTYPILMGEALNNWDYVTPWTRPGINELQAITRNTLPAKQIRITHMWPDAATTPAGPLCGANNLHCDFRDTNGIMVQSQDGKYAAFTSGMSYSLGTFVSQGFTWQRADVFIVGLDMQINGGSSNQIWVAPTNANPPGNDNNSGTDSSHPVANLTKAQSLVQGKPGAHVELNWSGPNYFPPASTQSTGFTTTLTAISGNNTPACTGPGAPDTGCSIAQPVLKTTATNTNAQTQVVDRAPSNVSLSSISNLMYPSFSGDVKCELQPWWGFSGHINIGQNDHDANHILTKLNSMAARGCTVVWVDAYSSNVDSGWDDTTLQLITTQLATGTPALKLEILVDQGDFSAICPQGSTDQKTCIVNKLDSVLDTYNTLYFGQSYYLLSSAKPVVSFFVTESLWSGTNFCTDSSGVWGQVRTHTNGYSSGGIKMIFRFGSFSHCQSDGEYAWVQPPLYSNTGGGASAPIITPATAQTVELGTIVPFSAQVPGTTNAAVTWSVKGTGSVGTVDSLGNYSAPPSSPGTGIQVCATSTATGLQGCTSVTVSGSIPTNSCSFTAGSGAAGDHNCTMTHDGMTRTFVVHIPLNFQAGTGMLLVGLPGIDLGATLMCAHGQLNAEGRLWADFADQQAAPAPAIACLDATFGKNPENTVCSRRWHSLDNDPTHYYGNTDSTCASSTFSVDDVDYIHQVILLMTSVAKTDPHHTFIDGLWQNGSQMARDYVSAHSEMVAGYDQWSFDAPIRSFLGPKPPAPVNPVSQLVMNPTVGSISNGYMICGNTTTDLSGNRNPQSSLDDEIAWILPSIGNPGLTPTTNFCTGSDGSAWTTQYIKTSNPGTLNAITQGIALQGTDGQVSWCSVSSQCNPSTCASCGYTDFSVSPVGGNENQPYNASLRTLGTTQDLVIFNFAKNNPRPSSVALGGSGGSGATSQYCWDDITGGNCNPATGVGSGVSYLNTFYQACLANPSKMCVGGIWKGFDWSNASWSGGVQKIIAEQCGRVVAYTGAKAGSNGFSSGTPLGSVGIDTWDDYEEGTEVESGVDNCYTVAAALSGSTLNWTLNAADPTYASTSTIDHFAIFYCDTSGNCNTAVDNLAPTATSQNLANLLPPAPTGQSWQMYVKMNGTPLIANQVSNAVAYTPPSCLGIICFTSADSGTAANPIVWEAAPGQTPVVSGGKNIGAGSGLTWTSTSLGGGNTKWTLSQTLSAWGGNPIAHIYVGPTGQDTVRRDRPRTTQSSSGYLRHAGSVCATVASTNCPASASGLNGCSAGTFACGDRMKYSGSDFLTTYHGMGIQDIDLIQFNKWNMYRMKPAPTAGDTTNACTTGAGTVCFNNSVYNWPANATSLYGFITNQNRYLVENCRPGDSGCETTAQASTNQHFYLDRCPTQSGVCTGQDTTWTLTYYTSDVTENPNTVTQVIQPFNAPPLITATGSHDITFSGWQLSYDNWTVPSTGIADSTGLPSTPGAWKVTDSQNLNWNNFKFAHINAVGLDFVTDQCTTCVFSNFGMTNVAIYDIGGLGVREGNFAKTGDTPNNVPSFVTANNVQMTGVQRYHALGIGGCWWGGNTHDNHIFNFRCDDAYNGGIRMGSDLNRSAASISMIYNNELDHGHVFNIGQGVGSDHAAFYSALSLSPNCLSSQNCNLYHDLWIHDIGGATTDPGGYGGSCLYFDGGSSAATMYNIICYRHTWAGIINSATDNQPNGDIYAQNNLVYNSIFAYQGTTNAINVNQAKTWLFKLGENPSSITARNNVVYINGPSIKSTCGGKPSVQNCPETHWSAYDCSTPPIPVVSNTRFLFSQNDYFDKSATALKFILTTPAGSLPPNAATSMCDPRRNEAPGYYTFTSYAFGTAAGQWQSCNPGDPCQDQGSLNVDPGFTNPSCNKSTAAACWADLTQDDYSFTGSPPAISFTPFPYRTFGTTPSFPFTVPSVPAGFPTTDTNSGHSIPLNPSTDF